MPATRRKLRVWTADGEYTLGQTTVTGQAAIAKLYDDYFRTNPGTKMEVRIDSIRLLAPTVALEQGTASVSDSPTALPTPVPTLRYTSSKRASGEWRASTSRKCLHGLRPLNYQSSIGWSVIGP